MSIEYITNTAVEQLGTRPAPEPDVYGPGSSGFGPDPLNPDAPYRSKPYTAPVLTGGTRTDIGAPVPKQD